MYDASAYRLAALLNREHVADPNQDDDCAICPSQSPCDVALLARWVNDHLEDRHDYANPITDE